MDRASRLRMGYTEMLLRSYSQKLERLDQTLESFETKLRSPRETQEATLLSILQRNAGCEYGQKHGFAAIENYQQYRNAVPIVDYEAILGAAGRLLAACHPEFWQLEFDSSGANRHDQFIAPLPAVTQNRAQLDPTSPGLGIDVVRGHLSAVKGSMRLST